MSVYEGEKASYIDEALQSLEDQTVQPQEIVLVKDGPVGEDIERTIDHWRDLLPIREVRLEQNMGLGTALRRGTEEATFELVARMDADDIACPDRLEKQLEFMNRHPDVDAVGSWIKEFEGSVDNVYGRREPPEASCDLLAYARHRNPLNHMTVMFRKSSVVEAGGYRPMPGLEDYSLWVRMLMNGCEIANIPDHLVWVRAGQEMVGRRGGMDYFLHECEFNFGLYSKGFISAGDLIYNLATRLVVRFMPSLLRVKLYRKFLRS
jgi:glycosyltransferase involved in cell wall biosynthesis